MGFGGFFKRLQSRRRRRIAMVRQLAGFFDNLDYDAARPMLSPDLVVVDGLGRRIEGRETVIKADRDFRIAAGRPRMHINEILTTADDVLVTGVLEGNSAEVTGPSFWRISFSGDLVSRIEITRNPDQMTVARYYSLRKK